MYIHWKYARSVFDLSSKVIAWLILEIDRDWRSQVTTTLTGVKHDQVTYDGVPTCDCKEYLLFQDRELISRVNPRGEKIKVTLKIQLFQTIEVLKMMLK